LQSVAGGFGEQESALSSSESSLDSSAASRAFSILSRSDSRLDSIALICASSAGCQFNYSYGEYFVFANKRRQGGKEEWNSDLLIDLDAGMGGDVDMAGGGEERDQDHQGAGQQGRQAGLIQSWDWLLISEIFALCYNHSERDRKRSSDGTQVPVRMASVERLMRGSHEPDVSDDGLEQRTREQG
jgi:hypothetical protein